MKKTTKKTNGARGAKKSNGRASKPRGRRSSGDAAVVTTVRLAAVVSKSLIDLAGKLKVSQSTVLRWALNAGSNSISEVIADGGVALARDVAAQHAKV